MSCFTLTHQITGHVSFFSCPHKHWPRSCLAGLGPRRRWTAAAWGRFLFSCICAAPGNFKFKPPMTPGGQQALHIHRELAPAGQGGNGRPVLTQPAASTVEQRLPQCQASIFDLGSEAHHLLSSCFRVCSCFPWHTVRHEAHLFKAANICSLA